ncbi:MAG: hypothetical protein Q9219_007159 [cf. Caloplaca sp. 3 TL-2023]
MLSLDQKLPQPHQTPMHGEPHSGGGVIEGWEQPSHPGLIQVRQGSDRRSAAVSLVSLPAGAHFANMTAATMTPYTTWTSVQYGKDGSSLELNSDLVFCNHSCRPSLVFDMSSLAVRVAEDRTLEVGDELTFFYPSTKWDMVEPFECECRLENRKHCGERIAGAKHTRDALLQKNWLNSYIRELLAAEGRTVSLR